MHHIQHNKVFEQANLSVNASQPGVVLARTRTIKPQNMFANWQSRWNAGETESGPEKEREDRWRKRGQAGVKEQEQEHKGGALCRT